MSFGKVGSGRTHICSVVWLKELALLVFILCFFTKNVVSLNHDEINFFFFEKTAFKNGWQIILLKKKKRPRKCKITIG